MSGNKFNLDKIIIKNKAIFPFSLYVTRVDTGKIYETTSLSKAFFKIAMESLEDRVEYRGILIAIRDPFNENEIYPLALIYEKGEKEDQTGIYSRKLEECLNEYLSKIKSPEPPILIPTHTHSCLPRPSNADIKSLKEWYEEGNKPENNRGLYEAANFGIIIYAPPDNIRDIKAIAFDTNGRYIEI